MATIDDFGGTTDPLNAPPLGGPSGWAAAVRDYLKDLANTKMGKTGTQTLQGNLTITSDDGQQGLTIGPHEDASAAVVMNPIVGGAGDATKRIIYLAGSSPGWAVAGQVPAVADHIMTKGAFDTGHPAAACSLNLGATPSGSWQKIPASSTIRTNDTRFSLNGGGIFVPASLGGHYEMNISLAFTYSGDSFTIFGVGFGNFSDNTICAWGLGASTRQVIGYGTTTGIEGGLCDSRASISTLINITGSMTIKRISKAM